MKKRALTLLEIMIVIFLITLITGTIGYSMRGTLDKGRAFRTQQAKEQLHDLLLICLADGAKPEDVAQHPASCLKALGLAKDPDNLVLDGWKEPFTITLNASKNDVNVTSKALINYENRMKKKGLHPLKRKKNKRAFTLLEIMVAIALIALASGVIGWKMHGAVRKKQFQSQLERLRDRFAVAQKLAVAMQADWRGSLKKEGKEWVLEIICEEGKAKKLSPLHLKDMEISFEGKKVDELTLDFYASGKVLPSGTFVFITPSDRVQWKTSEIFEREEGKKLGPLHPDEN